VVLRLRPLVARRDSPRPHPSWSPSCSCRARRPLCQVRSHSCLRPPEDTTVSIFPAYLADAISNVRKDDACASKWRGGLVMSPISSSTLTATFSSHGWLEVWACFAAGA